MNQRSAHSQPLHSPQCAWSVRANSERKSSPFCNAMPLAGRGSPSAKRSGPIISFRQTFAPCSRLCAAKWRSSAYIAFSKCDPHPVSRFRAAQFQPPGHQMMDMHAGGLEATCGRERNFRDGARIQTAFMDDGATTAMSGSRHYRRSRSIASNRCCTTGSWHPHQACSQAISLQNISCPLNFEFSALSGVGDATGGNSQRVGMVRRPMGTARRRISTTVGSETTVVRSRRPITNRGLANDLKPVISNLPRKEAAQSANRTVQAVNHWCEASRCADSASLLNLARDFDNVWKAICQVTGRVGSIEHDSPQANYWFALAQNAALMPGPEGDIVRAAMRKAAEQ